MIDIIIIDTNNDLLDKTLFSILIQTIRENVHVYLIRNKKKSLLPFFKERICVEEIVVENRSYAEMRNVGLDVSRGKFVIYFNSGDVFYDVFSLFNLYKLINDCDVVYGSIMNCSNHYSNHYIEGNLIRKSYLKRHRLRFFTEGNGSYEFRRLLFISNPRVVYSNDYSCCREDIDDWYNQHVDILQDSFCAFTIAKKRKYDKDRIAMMIYDVVLYYAYLYEEKKDLDVLGFFSDLLKSLKWYYYEYKKYLDLELKEYISELNMTNYRLDELIIEKFWNSI